MVSPSRSPSTTSKYSSPAMPTLTGRNVALAVPHHEHALGLLARPLELSGVHGGEFSLGTRSWSRTVSAMIGMLSALAPGVGHHPGGAAQVGPDVAAAGCRA